MTTNPNDYSAPSTIRTLLDRSICSVTDDINWYTKSPNVDFTRNRKITADTLIKFILLMETAMFKALVDGDIYSIPE